MSNFVIDQYREVLDGLPRVPISSSGEKYDRYRDVAAILQDVFTPEVWKEWDDFYPNIPRFKMGEQIEVNPVWAKQLEDLRFTTPRLTTFMIDCFRIFGSYHIEQFLAKNMERVEHMKTEKIIQIEGGWLNACDTALHAFWGFSAPMKNKIRPKVDKVKIRQAMVGSGLLDMYTFKRNGMQNYSIGESGELSHHSLFNEGEPTERVGCPAIRRFRGLNTETTVFSEFFDRVSRIYEYTGPEYTVQNTVPHKVKAQCPYHPEPSQ